MRPDEATARRQAAKARQLTLDLSRDPGHGAEDFLVSPSNADAFDWIDRWPDWPMPTLILVGPPGSGKSHLAAMWAEAAAALVVARTAHLDPVLAAERTALVLEDCDRAQRPDEALFHLMNLMREKGGALVLTARRLPDFWTIATRDLLSRLRQAPSVIIGAPEPDLLRAVMIKLFADRQIRIEDDVVAYAARHLDQSLEAVSGFVQAVDEAALASGRRITRPLAATTIDALAKSDREPDPVDVPVDQGPT